MPIQEAPIEDVSLCVFYVKQPLDKVLGKRNMILNEGCADRCVAGVVWLTDEMRALLILYQTPCCLRVISQYCLFKGSGFCLD